MFNYKPQQFLTNKIPVIIFSHGLASKPEDFEDLAQYLASYGYVVAMPQHSGSDFKQALALIKDDSQEVFDSNEFINRPQDISYVIDELERRNQKEFEGHLDLENVGVGGHSFGGYSALAVAGAQIDFDRLQKDCKSLLGGFNTSLLLQCRALKLPRKTYNFLDPRVKAVYAGNPVNSSIFGLNGLSKIQVPVILAAGNFDLATPAVYEQVRSFTWLNTTNKYLALTEGQTHIDLSKVDKNISSILDSVIHLNLPSAELVNNYRNTMILAFFQVHLLNNSQFRSYLTSAYSNYLSQNEPFKLYLISAASSQGLEQEFSEFNRQEGSLF